MGVKNLRFLSLKGIPERTDLIPRRGNRLTEQIDLLIHLILRDLCPFFTDRRAAGTGIDQTHGSDRYPR